MEKEQDKKTEELGTKTLEDLFDAIAIAEKEIGVEFCLTSGENERYAIKWLESTKQLTMEDDNLHVLIGFVFGYANGRMV